MTPGYDVLFEIDTIWRWNWIMFCIAQNHIKNKKYSMMKSKCFSYIKIQYQQNFYFLKNFIRSGDDLNPELQPKKILTLYIYKKYKKNFHH